MKTFSKDMYKYLIDIWILQEYIMKMLENLNLYW